MYMNLAYQINYKFLNIMNDKCFIIKGFWNIIYIANILATHFSDK